MGRKSARRNLLLLSLMAVILLAVVIIRQQLAAPPEPRLLFPGLSLDALTRVTVRHKERVVLVREAEGWMVHGAAKHGTDPLEVVKFLRNLVELRYFRAIPMTNLAQYRLDTPETEILIEAGSRRYRLTSGVDLETSIGNTQRTLTYVTVDGSGHVYTVETPHVARLQTSAQVLRAREILQFERQDLTGVELNYQGRTLTFRLDEKKQVWLAGDGRQIDRNRLMTFLVDFYRFKVDEFEADNAAPAVYGIRPGSNYLRVRGKAFDRTLSFGREIPNAAMRFCAVTGNPGVYRISVYKFERLNKQYSDFFNTPAGKGDK